MARMLFRNMQTFWYASYAGTVEDYDDYGNQIGTHAAYGNPVEMRGNISPAKGDVVARQFGDDDNYDKVIVLGDCNTPIDEYAVLWIDSTPEIDEDGSLITDETGNPVTPWDYVVRKIGRGLPPFGSVVIAVKKVMVS